MWDLWVRVGVRVNVRIMVRVKGFLLQQKPQIPSGSVLSDADSRGSMSLGQN